MEIYTKFDYASGVLEGAIMALNLISQRALWTGVCLLALAAALRIIGAGSYPVWTDEGWSIWAASDLSTTIDKLSADRHPPLYFLALGAWEGAAGDSRIALRFLSIAAGLLSVAAVYRLGADVLGRAGGLYAALLFATNPMAVYYSQEVRHYGWLVLGAALLSLFFLRYLRKQTRLTFILYTLSIVFSLYTLYFAVFILAIQGLIGLLAGGRARRGLFAAWVLAAVAFLPWAVVAVRQFTYLSVGLSGFPQVLSNDLNGLLEVARLMSGGQAALLAGLFAVGGWHLLKARGSERTTTAYLLLWGAGLLLVMWFGSPRLGLLLPRLLAFLVPGVMLVAGNGLAALSPGARRALAAALVIFVVISPGEIQPRLNSDEAARALAAHYSPGDLVVLETGWDDNAMQYELSRALPPGAPIVRTLPWVGYRQTFPVVQEIEPTIQPYQRVFVVNWLQNPQLLPALDAGQWGFRRALAEDVPVNADYRNYGDPAIHIVLFERPDVSAAPLVFGDRLALHDALLPESAGLGDALQVDLWWSALQPPALDYSIGVYLMDETGTVLAQHDGPPSSAPTTHWKPDTLVFDRHTLRLPAGLPPGTYTLSVRVYWYGDGLPLPVNGSPYAQVKAIVVQP
jgi:4-amino-4-deoxy-L-arabinose transferase-like glycosyltransferase